MILAGIVFFALLGLALFGERIAPHEPIFFVVEHGNDPRPYDPGIVFPFGSDVLGRDLFSLVLAGARATLTIVVLAGFARVTAGVLVAAIGSWWRPVRLFTESTAELVSAVPATLVALVLVKVFVRADTSVLVFIGALLLMGWAGPYRVIRAEVDRLAHAPFTEGARALGLGRWRIFWRHQLPHLVPVIAMNLSQQIIASLVLVAELGVLGAFVGTTRAINVEESMSFVRTGLPTSATVADPPEWGGLLAGSRTTEALWTTRWLILLPGVAFALTAIAVATVGFVVARRYARRDLVADLRGRSAVAFVAIASLLVLAPALVPERYAAAREWAVAARSAVQPTGDVPSAFADAGLRPLGSSYAIERRISTVVQTAGATVSAGSTTLTERWPRQLRDVPDRDRTMWSFLTSATAGGTVDAPLVFAARGISAADHQPRPQPFGQPRVPDFAQLIRDYEYADDYAGIDVRGKVVLLVRFDGINGYGTTALSRRIAAGPFVDVQISKAIERGAAAVIFVDRALYLYNDIDKPGIIFGLGGVRGGLNPYLRAERDDPPTRTSGVPVVVLGEDTAKQLVKPLGLDLTPYFGLDERNDPRWQVSGSRELGVSARVQVPLERKAATVTSYAAEVPGADGSRGRVVVWGTRRPDAPGRATDVITALGRSLGPRNVPFVFVDFDPSIDPVENARAVRDVLGDRRIALVLVLDDLQGSAVRFTTANGDLVPALDLYAQKANARYVRTTATAKLGATNELMPLPGVPTVVVRGTGGDGDPRGDTAAVIGYLAGRLAFGAEELPR